MQLIWRREPRNDPISVHATSSPTGHGGHGPERARGGRHGGAGAGVAGGVGHGRLGAAVGALRRRRDHLQHRYRYNCQHA